jgi:hypothetical protein
LWDEALRRIGDAERRQTAEQQHPSPDIDIDAVFVAAHPSRQHHLRDERKSGAGDTNEKVIAGHSLGER